MKNHTTIGFKTKKQLKKEGVKKDPLKENKMQHNEENYNHEVDRLIDHSDFNYDKSVDEYFQHMIGIMFKHFPEAPLHVKEQMLGDLYRASINKYINKLNK